MANISVIAKPYAKAAFEFASEQGAIQQWSSQLNAFADTVQIEGVAKVIANPEVSQTDVIAAISAQVDQNFANFLALVAEKKRLELLPSIAEQFEKIKNSQINSKKADITLAYEVDDALLSSLKSSLEKKFNCSIDLDVKINPAIIGGAIVEIEGAVIDDSISGRIERMKSILLS